jgi:hypothetical protein
MGFVLSMTPVALLPTDRRERMRCMAAGFCRRLPLFVRPIFGPFWLDNQRKPPTPVILSRLAGPLRDVVQYARPHRKPKGTIVLYKTRDCAEELRKAGRVLARHKLRVTGSYDILLPLSRVPRRFVVLGS